MSDIDRRKLSTVVERVERLVEEKKGVEESIKEVLAEAKASGLEPKHIRRLVRERAQDPEKARMEEAEYEAYRAAMDMA